MKAEESSLRGQQEAQAAKVGDMEMEKESIERVAINVNIPPFLKRI